MLNNVTEGKKYFTQGTTRKGKTSMKWLRMKFGAYKDKVEHKYSSGDLRAAWRGIKSMSSANNIQDENSRAPIRIIKTMTSQTNFLFRVFPLSLTVI